MDPDALSVVAGRDRDRGKHSWCSSRHRLGEAHVCRSGLLRGVDLEATSGKHRVSIATLTQWRL
jgi:hypothetical protein